MEATPSPNSSLTPAAGPEQDRLLPLPRTLLPIYEGLSRVQRLWIVFGAVAVVLLNMAFAGYVMYASSERIQFGAVDQATVAALAGGIQGATNAAVMRSKSIDAIVNMKLVSNKQAIGVVAVAGAFSLMAMGFALFLLGADGVFRLQADAAQGAKLIFSGTAPGLFCFLMAAGLIAAVIFHRSELQLGETTFQGIEVPASAPVVSLFNPDGSFKPAPKGNQ